MVDQTVSIIGVLKDGISPAVGKIDLAFLNLGTRLRAIGNTLSPLTSGIAQFVTAVGGASLIKTATDAAEKKLAVDQRLLAALNLQVAALEKISTIADEIEGKTLFDGDDLKGQAATLLNMGVAVEKIGDRLATATDVATGLGIPIEAAVKAIGKFESNQAGELGKLIPQLRELQEAGSLETEGIPLLQRLFGGQAEAAAQGIVGELFRARQGIESELKKIGEPLLEIKVAILEGLAEPLKVVSEFVASPLGQGIVQLFSDIAPEAVKVAAGVAAVGVAIQAMTFALGPVYKLTIGLTIELVKLGAALIGNAVLGVVSLTTSLFSLRGAMTLAQIGIVAFVASAIGPDGFSKLGDSLSDSGSRVAEVFERVKSGEATFEELAEVAVTELKVIAVSADVLIYQPIQRALNNSVELAKVSFSSIGSFFENIFTFQGLDAAKAAAAEEITSFLSKKVEEELVRGTPDQEIATRAKEIRDESEVRVKEIQARAAKAAGESFDAARDKIDKAVELGVAKMQIAQKGFERAQQSAIGVSIAGDLESQSPGVRNALIGVDEEFAQPIRDLIQKRIVEGIEAGTLGADKGVELFRQSELLALQDQNRVIDDRIVKEREQLALLQSYAEFQKDVVDRLRERQASLEEIEFAEGRLLSAINVAIESQNELADLERDRVRNLLLIEEATDKIRALESEIATKVVETVREQKSALDERISAIKELERSGDIGPEESAGRQNAATEEFRQKLTASRVELDAMRAKWPEIATQIDAANKELSKLESQLKTATVEADSFAEGFVDGVNSAAESLDSLRELGAEVGRDLAQSLSSGIIDVFVTGKKTFREYVADVLAGIGELLIQYAVLNAVKSGINALDSDSPTTGSTVAGVAGTAAAQGAGESIGGGIADFLGLGDDAAPGNIAAGTVTVTGQVVNVTGGIGGAATGGGAVPAVAQAAGSSTEGILPGILPAATGTEAAAPALAETAPAGLDAATAAAGAVPATAPAASGGGGLGGLLGGLGSLLGSAGGGIGSLLSGAGGGIGSLLGGAGGGLSSILGGAGGLLGGAGGGIGSLLSSILPALTSFLGPIGPVISILLGGLFHEGGTVPGDPAAGDATLIAAQGGEFVQPLDAVAHFGVDAMEAIRNRSISRAGLRALMSSSANLGSVAMRDGYHDGGSVSGVGRRSRSRSTPTPAYVVPDERSAEMWNANSRRAQLDFIGKNKADILARLGLSKRRQ